MFSRQGLLRLLDIFNVWVDWWICLPGFIAHIFKVLVDGGHVFKVKVDWWSGLQSHGSRRGLIISSQRGSYLQGQGYLEVMC